MFFSGEGSYYSRTTQFRYASSPRDVCAGGQAPEVTVHLGWVPALDPSEKLIAGGVEGGPIWSMCDSARVRVRYPDQTCMVIGASGSEIWIQWPADQDVSDALTYVMGPGMGVSLALQGVPSLHASVAIPPGSSTCAMFVGPAGAGKSTTVAGLVAKMGWCSVTEDTAALDQDVSGGITVRPGYPLIRLWPQSVQLLGGTLDEYPALTPNWSKRYMDLAGSAEKFATFSSRPAAIFVFEGRHEGPESIRVTPISAAESLPLLIAEAYVRRVVAPRQRAIEFGAFGWLANNVKAYRLSMTADSARFLTAIKQLSDWSLDAMNHPSEPVAEARIVDNEACHLG